MKPNRKAPFTLIELMVVVAIIGILASILLPALQRAKAISLQAVCLNNEKQVYLAVQLYADDFESILPAAYVYKGSTSSEDVAWHDQLRDLYTGDVPGTWICPARERASYRSDYGWNYGGKNPYHDVGLGYCAWTHPTNGALNPRGWPISSNRIETPEGLFMFGEARRDYYSHIGLIGTQLFNGQPQYPPYSTYGQDAYPIAHFRGSNVMYADGHAKYETRVFMGDAEASHLWTLDND